jgi:hypothetical protein
VISGSPQHASHPWIHQTQRRKQNGKSTKPQIKVRVKVQVSIARTCNALWKNLILYILCTWKNLCTLVRTFRQSLPYIRARNKINVIVKENSKDKEPQNEAREKAAKKGGQHNIAGPTSALWLCLSIRFPVPEFAAKQ